MKTPIKTPIIPVARARTNAAEYRMVRSVIGES